MEIRSVRHRGLRYLIEEDRPRFVPPALVDRVRKIVTVLILAETIADFRSASPQGWRTHQLSGDRAGDWSVSVTGNWRITFREVDGSIDHLNLEDYH